MTREIKDATHQIASPHSHKPIMEESSFNMKTAWAVIPGIMKSSGRMSAANPPSWTAPTGRVRVSEATIIGTVSR